MKILLLNLWGVMDGKGGTEKVFFDMAGALAERNHDVTALVLENKTTLPFFNVSRKISFVNCGMGFAAKFSFWQNLYIKLCPEKNKRHSYRVFPTPLHSYRDSIVDEQKAQRLEPVIVKENPDVIISFNAEATRVVKLHMDVKCPVITMFHFNPEHIFSNCTVDTKKALEMSECIQVLMPSFINKTKEYINHDNIVCISNTVPQYELTNEIENNRKNIIINLARIDKLQKRQHIIIEAFNLLAKDFPDWKVEFWGEKDSDIKYYNYCLNCN